MFLDAFDLEPTRLASAVVRVSGVPGARWTWTVLELVRPGGGRWHLDAGWLRGNRLRGAHPRGMA